MDNTKWVPTEDDETALGPRPSGTECVLQPIDCEEYYPWPEDDCVELDPASGCIASYIPECLQQFTVMAVYTRMPNPSGTLCNWLTLEQRSLRPIRAGDEVEIRMRHATLTAPVSGMAHMSFVVDDEIVLDYEVEIEPPPGTPPFFPKETWVAPKDYPAGTRLLFHVDNHGSNEYMLIEVNVL